MTEKERTFPKPGEPGWKKPKPPLGERTVEWLVREKMDFARPSREYPLLNVSGPRETDAINFALACLSDPDIVSEAPFVGDLSEALAEVKLRDGTAFEQAKQAGRQESLEEELEYWEEHAKKYHPATDIGIVVHYNTGRLRAKLDALET